MAASPRQLRPREAPRVFRIRTAIDDVTLIRGSAFPPTAVERDAAVAHVAARIDRWLGDARVAAILADVVAHVSNAGDGDTTEPRIRPEAATTRRRVLAALAAGVLLLVDGLAGVRARR